MKRKNIYGLIAGVLITLGGLVYMGKSYLDVAKGKKEYSKEVAIKELVAGLGIIGGVALYSKEILKKSKQNKLEKKLN